VLTAFLIGAPSALASQTPPPGTILTFAGGFGSAPSMYGVDPSTGRRTALSDLANAVQGPTFFPYRVAGGAGGMVVATGLSTSSADHGLLVRINPATSQRTVISDFTNPGQGPIGYVPFGVAVESSTVFLVTDRGQGGGGNGAALWRVNGGIRTKLSDFNNAAQGPTGTSPEGVALDASGHIYVADAEAGSQCNLPSAADRCGALFRVDGTTGQRTLVSDFGNVSQGPTGEDPNALAFDPTDGTVLVLDDFAGACGCGELFRVNPATGARTVLSDFGNAGQGPTGGARPDAVVVAADGTILTDGCPGVSGDGAICVINRTTGARTNFADFGDSTLGPVAIGPRDGLAFMPVVPTPRSTTTVLDCATATPADEPASCKAVVTDTATGSPIVPSGTVTFTSSGPGAFGSTTCVLAPAGGPAKASCTVTYTRGDRTAQTVTAHYPGDGIHAASSGSASFPGLRPTSTTLSCVPDGYRFSLCTATVTDIGPGAPTAPAGTVAFSSPVPFPFGFHAGEMCSLHSGPPPGVSSCFQDFIAPSQDVGSVTATARYIGDPQHEVSTGSASIQTGQLLKAAALASGSATVAPNGMTALTVTCPGPFRCAGTVQLTVARSGAAADAAAAAHRAAKVIAVARFAIRARHTGKVRLRLTSAGRNLLARHAGRLSVTAIVTTTAHGRSATRRRRVTLSSAAGTRR
jgi:uncharacterized repeat protein (TIGR03803 family)